MIGVLGVGTCAVRTFSAPVDATAGGLSGALAPGNGSAHAAGNSGKDAVPRPIRFAETLDETVFLRGNLHTHSKRSDGDSSPADVYTHYRDRGYSFLVLSDHNTRTNPDNFKSIQRSGFVMVPGEEVTTLGDGKPVHVNAICSQKTVGGGVFPTTREALQWAVAQVIAQGAIALINHPNFEWALGADDMPSAKGAALIEIWSGHPHVPSLGDVFHPSHEALWSGMLDDGRAIYGVAVDDMHNLKDPMNEPHAIPERAWVNVFAGKHGGSAQRTGFAPSAGRASPASTASTTSAAPEAQSAPDLVADICNALKAGHFYSSAGPAISHISVGGKKFSISLSEAGKVEFIGAEGAILRTASLKADEPAEYDLQGGEQYVRARILGANGERAWTQAYVVVPET